MNGVIKAIIRLGKLGVKREFVVVAEQMLAFYSVARVADKRAIELFAEFKLQKIIKKLQVKIQR